MYSPDISQHSPQLYRLGRHYRKPMTEIADRLICFGLQRLEQVFVEEQSSTPEQAVAETPGAYPSESGPVPKKTA